MLDRAWFRIDYKKAEKGLEVLEHYHYGIGLIGLGIYTFVHAPAISYFILGAGFSFVYHEAKQKNLFAIQSAHFESSTAIGIVLCAITAAVYFL